MKKLILNSGAVFVALITIIVLFYGCENVSHKPEEVKNKNSDQLPIFGLTNNDNIFLNLIIQDSTNNIYSEIRLLLNNLNLSYNSSDTPLGIALLFDDIIDTVDFENLKAVVYYYNDTNENRVKVWFNNNGNLQLDQSYSKISQFIANEDIYRIDQINNLNTNQVLLMIDQTSFPTLQYYSEFQTLLDRNYSLLLPSDPVRTCSPNPECSQPWSGSCIYSESQQGVSTSCPNFDDCTVSNTSLILINNSTPLDTTTIPNIYNIRDLVLLNNNKFGYLIEDYYYLSSKISQNITLSIALNVYDLSNTNFLRVLKNYNNPIYADSILFTTINKPLILSICNKSKNLTSDTKSQNIINNVINLVNTYENKTISYIKNN